MSKLDETYHCAYPFTFFQSKVSKIMLAVFCVAAALILVLVSVLAVTNVSAVDDAAEPGIIRTVTAPSGSEATAAGQLIAPPKTEYLLPYPGILPDHPLYWVKMIRDRVWLWMTTDQEKADRLILYADKRLGAGKALIEGNKKALGATTLTKAAKYLERAAAAVKQLPGENSDLKNKLRSSALKHQEILSALKADLPETLQKPWSDAAAVIEQILK